MVLWVVGVSVLLVFAMILGLTRMAGNEGSLVEDENILVSGAKLFTENGVVKVTVVDFSDMQCPACKIAHELTKELRNTQGVKFVFRHFPLLGHKYSTISAKAVEAARQMGKGWEMMDMLFNLQDEWSVVSDKEIENRLVKYAASLGMDETVFSEKLKSLETEQSVGADRSLGNSLKLNGTPTLFINGEQVSPEFVMPKVRELLNKQI